MCPWNWISSIKKVPPRTEGPSESTSKEEKRLKKPGMFKNMVATTLYWELLSFVRTTIRGLRKRWRRRFPTRDHILLISYGWNTFWKNRNLIYRFSRRMPSILLEGNMVLGIKFSMLNLKRKLIPWWEPLHYSWKASHCKESNSPTKGKSVLGQPTKLRRTLCRSALSWFSKQLKSKNWKTRSTRFDDINGWLHLFHLY